MESPPKQHQDILENSLPRDAVRLPKKLIMCCDGTWQDSDNGWVPGTWGRPGHAPTPTNVTRISRAISSLDDTNHPQIVYYQAGIGSGIGLVNHFVGGGTGLGLSENIREAYAFLASNYSPQDDLCQSDSIFLLGFSRGAFTARSLGGFIGAVGILSKTAMPFFYQCFLDWEHAGDSKYTPMFVNAYIKAHPDKQLNAQTNQPSLQLARDPKRIDEYLFEYRKHLLSLGLTQEVKIKCIGVWDTVGALGIPINPILQRLLPFLPAFLRDYQWFDTRLSNCVENAFQALALDENRFPFTPSVWEQDANSTTNMKQVWFPGAHSNIGGSYNDSGIANITLAWMMDQLSGNARDPSLDFHAADWIKFDEKYIDHWHRQTADFYASDPDRKSYSGWGMGKVYNSNTLPQSLLGRKVRAPGTYHRTDYRTGKTLPQRLQNTHEHIHASVRARIDLAGHEVQPEQPYQGLLTRLWRYLTFQPQDRPYQPQRAGSRFLPVLFAPHGPLYRWRLRDGHTSHAQPNLDIDTHHPSGLQEVVWQHSGSAGSKTSDAPVLPMPEDRMVANGFEQRLLMHDGEIAKQVLYSNNKWRWFQKVPEQEAMHSHTF